MRGSGARHTDVGPELRLLCIALGVVLGGAAASADGDSEVRQRLQHAFRETFEPDCVRDIELRIVRGDRVVARRGFEIANAHGEHGSRTLLRFTEPDYMRGHALLVIDVPARGTDTWLYQPEARRTRRVSTAQKRDAFFGSDLSFEDLETPRWDRWSFGQRGALEASVPLWWIDALPPSDSQYGRLRIFIDERRERVVAIDFFRPGAEAPAEGSEPVKRMRVDLAEDSADRSAGHATRIEIRLVGRDARSELVVRRHQRSEAIEPRLLSAGRLEREGESLFDLIGRRREEGNERDRSEDSATLLR